MIPTPYRHSWALAALVSGALWSAPALACKCKPQSVDEAKQDALAIFEGRVSSIVDEPKSETNPAPGKLVTVALVRTWRGLENEEAVTLRTAEASASCGYPFELGASYLVYAGGEPDKLQVSHCSRTRPLSEAGEDLAALGVGITPVKVEAQDAGAPPAKKPKSGGCASHKASAGTSTASLLWFGAPVAGFVTRRRRRRAD